MQQLKETDFSWHAGQPDVPNKSAEEMKAFLDAPVHKLLEKINEILGGDEAQDLTTLGSELKRVSDNTDEIRDSVHYNVDRIGELFEMYYFLQSWVKLLDGNKQDYLTAGQNITIDENKVISSTFDGAIHNTLQVGEGTGFKLEGAMPYINGVTACDDPMEAAEHFVSAEDIRRTVQSVDAMSPDVYVLDHFDLTETELEELIAQCHENNKVLLCRVGNMRYICPQVSMTTAGLLVFIYVGCSSDGEILFKRFAYNPGRLNDDGTVYHSEKEFHMDHIIETGTDGVWNYRKWSGGTYEAWCQYEVASVSTEQAGNIYVYAGEESAPSFSEVITSCFSDNSLSGAASWGASNFYQNTIWHRTFAAEEPSGATLRVCLKITGVWE